MRITPVTTLTCERCGTEFDTDREPATKGADTSRCASCGAKNTEPRPHADGGETNLVPRDVDEVQLTAFKNATLDGADEVMTADKVSPRSSAASSTVWRHSYSRMVRFGSGCWVCVAISTDGHWWYLRRLDAIPGFRW